MSHPRQVGGQQVGRPPPLARELRRQVEHPPRRHPLDAAAEVAAWHAEQVVCGSRQRPAEVAVLALHLLGSQRQLTGGRGPLVVGEQGVVVHGCGEGPLGQAEHHHQVEVEPDAHLDRADQHALAQATDPTQVVVELDLDRAVEDIEGHRILDGVEARRAVGVTARPARLPSAPRDPPSADGGWRRRATG